MRQRVALAAAVLAALVLPSLAVGSAPLTGKYMTKITAPAEFKGTWVLTFAKGGSYTVTEDGHVVVRGRYSTSGSKITFSHETGPLSCTKAGTYTWRQSGNTLRFTRQSDALCTGRAGVLGHTFTTKS
jgi:hypothetical protein